MNRRKLMKLAAMCAATPFIPLGLSGCSYTKQDLITDAGIVDTTVSAVLTALGQTALAAEIQGYLTQFDTAVTNWQGGSTSAVIISVLQDLELALGDTTLNPIIVAAADAAISGIELLIENLSKTTPTASLAIQPRASVQHTVRAKPAVAKSRKDAVKQWNAAIKGTPLALHTIHEPMF
jgi:1-aminocyclopropane-1-carboxylate deaminase/D-cysteine desulfhydrase-like pyridoxal-dependent ACC family enzyme